MDERMTRRIKTAGVTLERIRNDFPWQHAYLQHLAALSFSVGGHAYDTGRMRTLNDRIRSAFGVFSPFRSASFQLAMYFLTEADDADRAFRRLTALEPLLRQEGVRSYAFAPLLAAVLVRSDAGATLQAKVQRTKEAYEELHRKHPFLTGADDYPLAAMLATSDGSLASRLADVESVYFLLHLKGLSKGNGLQLLSLILSIGKDSAQLKAERSADLLGRFAALGIRVWPQYYGALGLLALLPEENGVLAERAVEIVQTLRARKRYKMLDKGMLLLFAAILLADDAVGPTDSPVAAGVMLEVLIEAQTAAMLAATVATTSAAASASS